MLIAGELELIAREDITADERKARISVAKTLCYHKNYLDDGDIHNGYDQIMKRVERGTQDWNEALGEHLHEMLNYRANVLLRERVHADVNSATGFTKVENKKGGGSRRKNDQEEARIVYCQDYNNGSCIHSDHHQGKFAGRNTTKFAGRNTTKFHICKRCHQSGEIRSHRDTDTNCPKRAGSA